MFSPRRKQNNKHVDYIPEKKNGDVRSQNQKNTDNSMEIDECSTLMRDKH